MAVKLVRPHPNCIGKFRISDDLIRQDWKQLLPLMAKMVVVRCQHVWPFTFEYTAYSDMFEPVEEGLEPFEYEILVTEHAKGEGDEKKFTYTFEAKKLV